MALLPRFQLHLPEKVLTARAALGRFDGATTLIAFATSAGKVVLHNTQDASAAASAGPRQAHLNINKQVSVLATGPLLPNSVRDVLLVGTPTCLHCYDVEHNRDLFFRDVPEGVACICVGSFGVQHRGATLALVGGAGALQAFDSAGREVFWSAVSGGVTALALADVDEDGCNELLVGCDDGCIWVYRDKDVVQQIHEADAVVALTGLGQGRKWAYALANGTIGVYEGGVRLWRVKSKHGVTSLAALDLGAAAASAGGGGGGGGSSGKEGSSSSSTQPQLISGWSSGRVEARSISSGEVVGRDSLGGSIAALLLGQLRQAEGAELELLAVSSDGELRGYVPHNEELVADVGGDVSLQQRLLVELAQKKHQLVYELGSYHGYQAATGSSGSAAADGGLSASSIGSALAGGLASSLGAAGLGPGNSGGGSSAAAAGGVGADRGHIASIIPPDTRVHSALTINRATQMCELVLKTSNDAVIRAALIFGEQVFEGESLLVAPQQPGPTLMVPLATRRDAPVLLLMKVLVGSRMSAVYHLFELDLEMPKFALYAAEEQPPPGGVPEGHVCFELQHPVSSVASWLETRFGCRVQLAAAPQGSGSGSGSRGRSDGGGRQQQQLTAHFTCLRTKQPLAVRAAPRQLGGLMVWLHFDSMALAGSLLQDLAARLGISELSSTASFPAAMAALRATLSQVEAASAARNLVDSEAAGMAAGIKAAVVRAEDSRLLGDAAGLRRAHKRLADLNRSMWLEHSRRVANQQALLEGLKEVNQMIQAAAGLRVGPAQARVVAACRAAVKKNNLQALEKLVASGG